MVMLMVVPIEEGVTEAAGILNGAKLLGKQRLVLEGFELGLGKGIVIGDMRARVALGDAQIR